jgi:hypothetical protein
MIKRYKDFEAKVSSGGGEKLPVGGYICKILNPEVIDYSWGSVLVLSVDIDAGEYKGFYANQYKNNTNEDKKWKGTLRVNLPKDDGSEQDGWTKNAFNNVIGCIEEANPNFRWAWDEQGLKGKTIGIAFREEEWEVNGKTGWATRPWRAIPVADIEDCKINPKWLEPKPLKNKAPAAAIPAVGEFSAIPSDIDLPWN